MIHSSWSLGLTFSHPLNTPMINSKPAALPSCCASTRSLIAMIVYTVEVALPATPPAVSSGESATLRLPLSIIIGSDVGKHTPPIAPEGALCPVCSQLNRAGQRWGSGIPVPRPFVCGPLRTRGLEVTTMRRQITESMSSSQTFRTLITNFRCVLAPLS
jgi:hypothetical protein